MKMEKIKCENFEAFIKKNKLILTLLLATVFIFLSTIYYPLIYIATVVLIIGAVFLDFNDIFTMFIYMSVFGSFLVPFIATIIVGFIVIVIKYIIDVKNKRAEFIRTPFIITTILSVLYSIIHYEINDLGIYQGFMIIAFLYFIYFMIVYRKSLNIKKYFDYLYLGLIISIAISGLAYLIPNTQTLSFDANLGYIMQSMKSKVVFDDGEYVRITLLSFHVNHLAAFCLFAMAYSSILVLTKKQNTKKDYIYYIAMYAINLIVGLLTLSKAFIVVFAFEICITLLYYLLTHRKKAIKIIVITLAVCGLLTILFRNKFVDIFERFFVYNYDTLLGMLTTGRSGIWQQYANAILESPLKLLFGFGLFSQEQLLIGPHNFYIFLLYRFGIVGILIIAYLIYSYFKAIKTKLNFSIKYSLIMLTFLVIGLQEACIDERFFFFVIGVALLFTTKKETVDEKI